MTAANASATERELAQLCDEFGNEARVYVVGRLVSLTAGAREDPDEDTAAKVRAPRATVKGLGGD